MSKVIKIEELERLYERLIWRLEIEINSSPRYELKDILWEIKKLIQEIKDENKDL